MDSNVRMAHMINVIMVESVIGKGIESDPVRPLIEYFDLEGERLAYRDDWAEEEKAKPDMGVDVLMMSYPLTAYLGVLHSKGEIEYLENESTFDVALRLLKAQRETLRKYDRVIRTIEESNAWNLGDSWKLHDAGPCTKCKRNGNRDEERLCFSCWTRLQEARDMADLVTP